MSELDYEMSNKPSFMGRNETLSSNVGVSS